MPPKAKKSKKEIEEEKSKALPSFINYRETRRRKEDLGGAGTKTTGRRGEKEAHRGGEKTRGGGET